MPYRGNPPCHLHPRRSSTHSSYSQYHQGRLPGEPTYLNEYSRALTTAVPIFPQSKPSGNTILNHTKHELLHFPHNGGELPILPLPSLNIFYTRGPFKVYGGTACFSVGICEASFCTRVTCCLIDLVRSNQLPSPMQNLYRDNIPKMTESRHSAKRFPPPPRYLTRGTNQIRLSEVLRKPRPVGSWPR